MPTYTTNLNLKKTDMATDGDDYFKFDEDLDANSDKIDERFGSTDIVISPNNWEGVAAPYTQTVEVQGMTETINPTASLIYSNNYETAQSERSEYSKIYAAESQQDAIIFKATSPTGIALSLRIKNL